MRSFPTSNWVGVKFFNQITPDSPYFCVTRKVVNEDVSSGVLPFTGEPAGGNHIYGLFDYW
ncbi:hypothetical protein HanIR_Chr09g0390451 [Helianthus annuus]|nr:hypothetical protein HanIR_Chr09g0390451 [Helianthus annuus]